MKKEQQNTSLEASDSVYAQIKQVLLQARATVLTTVNTAMVQAYWHVGQLIVEAQGGAQRAAYGDDLIKSISARLTKEFGKGFTPTNLRYMRMFYLAFPICHSLSDKLSWTHYRMLTKVSNPKAREYYAKEAAAGNWSVRQLERQIATQYYERQLSTHREVCQPDDNPTIGIILCSEKNDTVIEYTLGDRKDIGVFSAKYDLIMPTREELTREIELTRQKFKMINS